MGKRQVVTLEELKKENRYSGVLPVWVGDYPTQVIPTIELIYTKLYELEFGLVFPTPPGTVNFDSQYSYALIKTSVEIIASRNNVLILFVIPRYEDSGLISNGILDVMTGYSLGLFNTYNSAIYIQDDLFGIGDDMLGVDGVSAVSGNNVWDDAYDVFKDFLPIKKYVWQNPYEANTKERNIWYHILYSLYNSPLPYYKYYSVIDNLNDFIYKGKKEEILTEVRIDIEKYINMLMKHVLKSLYVNLDIKKDIIYNFDLSNGRYLHDSNLYKTIAKKCIDRYIDSNIFKDAGFEVVVNIHEPSGDKPAVHL